jgi:putative DNA primase/helicase
MNMFDFTVVAHHADKLYLDLIKKLTTPEELSGLLNLALKGLKEPIEAGGFHDTSVEDTRRFYEEHTNDVNAFLANECAEDISNRNYYTLVTDLYAAYVTFCKGRGTRPTEMNAFGRKLADHGIYAIRRQDDKSRERHYEGVKLLRDMRDIGQQIL